MSAKQRDLLYIIDYHGNVEEDKAKQNCNQEPFQMCSVFLFGEMPA